MKLAFPALPLLAIVLSACVENAEEITIRPDGSVAVEIKAKGKPADLADGYAVPLHAPWTAENAATLEWLRVLGGDTGSASVRSNLAALGEANKIIRPKDDLELHVRADFPSVEDLPHWLAPESEPFRTAYLERASDLRVERKGGRTVYVFERTYRGRTFERTDAMSRMKGTLDKKLYEKVEGDAQLTDEERSQVVDSALEAMQHVAVAFASDALLPLYTQGDASLSPQAAERVLGSVREAIARVVVRERLERIIAGVLPPKGQAKSDEAEADLGRLDKEVRETLRASFAQALETERMPGATRNALRGGLEWLFTARDHTEDLGDESFALLVHLPGTIVGGNYDEIDGGAAAWKLDGKTLRDRDRVLRVVSVVE
jgi:hypothetical protein